MKKRIIEVLLVVLMSLCLVSCGAKPEDTVTKFFSAVKSGDVDTCIECFVPSIQEQWKLGMAAGDAIGSFFGIEASTSELLSSLIGIVNDDYYQNYEFAVGEAEYSGDDKAVVPVEVTDAGEYITTTEIELLKIENEWLIRK